MPLDIFQRDYDESVNYAATHSAPDLPATAAEAFNAAFMHSVLFGQSTAALAARATAAADYAAELEDRTGDRSLRASLSSGGIDRMNARIAQIKADHPELDIAPLNEDELAKRQAALSRQAVTDYQAMAAREKTLGGSIGFFGGEAAGGVTDPVNLVTFPLAAPASMGVIGTAAAWAGIGGGTQLAIEAIGAPYRERISPGYLASGQPLANVAGAAAFAGVLGGGLKGAGALWTKMRTGQWPRSVRDAGNVVDSEANVAATNALPGAEGEVAHREALSKAIDDIAAGRPVDVGSIVTPELWQASQDVIARMESQHAFALPVIDESAIRLASEEAVLRERAAALAGEMEKLPPIQPDAALRLARLQAIEDQLPAASFDQRKALMRRRDELLADTTPEQLRAEASPIEARRTAEAERTSIATRLAEIAQERAQRGIEASATPPVAIGQGQLARLRPGEEAPPNTTVAGALDQALAAEIALKPPAAASGDMKATEDALLRNLDKLRAERPGEIAVPIGETIGADGRPAPVLRNVEEILTEADARLSAAKEIMDCVGGYPEAAP